MALQKLSGRSSLQAPKAQGRLPLAGYLTGRLLEGGPALKPSRREPQEGRIQEAGHKRTDSQKPATRRPTPRCRPQEGRLPASGQDCTLKDCTHITVTRWGVATVKPATPESWSTHGHSAPYGSAIPRPARHCCHVDHDATHDRLLVQPAGGRPLQPERRSKAAKPPPVRLGCSRRWLIGSHNDKPPVGICRTYHPTS